MHPLHTPTCLSNCWCVVQPPELVRVLLLRLSTEGQAELLCLLLDRLLPEKREAQLTKWCSAWECTGNCKACVQNGRRTLFTAACRAGQAGVARALWVRYEDQVRSQSQVDACA